MTRTNAMCPSPDSVGDGEDRRLSDASHTMIGTRVCGLERSLVPILGVLQPLRANSKKTVESSPPGPGTRLHFSAPLMPSAASTSHDKTMTLAERAGSSVEPSRPADRKSTRLNSSHVKISYAVFCLKKKNVHKNSNIASHERV